MFFIGPNSGSLDGSLTSVADFLYQPVSLVCLLIIIGNEILCATTFSNSSNLWVTFHISTAFVASITKNISQLTTEQDFNLTDACRKIFLKIFTIFKEKRMQGCSVWCLFETWWTDWFFLAKVLLKQARYNKWLNVVNMPSWFIFVF